MKVVFTIDSLQQGGAEQSLVHTIQHFPKDIQVVVVYLYPKETLLPALEKTGCKIISLNLKGRMKWINGIVQLKKIIQTHNPDIMVSCLYESNIISRMVSKQTGVPLIGTLVSDSYSSVRIASFGWKRKIGFYLYYLIDRYTSSIPLAWIANSKSVKETNARKLKIPDDKIEVIYRGRNAEHFWEWSPPNEANGFRFAFIGRLLETKGLVELIQSFKKIDEQTQDVALDIYGEGPFRSKLETLIHENGLTGKVILHGNVKDAWKELYKAHVFVFPSWYEGFSGALVEAMMVGLPIIASDIPMNLEAVADNTTAYIFPVKNQSALLEKMKEVKDKYHAAEVIGKNAKELSKIKFDIKQVSETYSHFLKNHLRQTMK
jgi:glycosyltransferase involved in cell wall biosynthesis